MKQLLLATALVFAAIAANAETVLIQDDFDNGVLGTNTTGTGTGFNTTGQQAATESGGTMNLNGTNNNSSTHVASSKDSFNPFQSTSTTLRFNFSTINRDPDGQRLFMGYRLASSSDDHFLPDRGQGVYIALIADHDGPGSGNTDPSGVLIVVDHLGNDTEMARWTWGGSTDLDNLEVELTTTSSSYSLSFTGATPLMVSGSLTGSNLASAIGTVSSNFSPAIHNQYWGTAAEGGVLVDSVSATFNGPEITVEDDTPSVLTSGSSIIAYGDQRAGTSSAAKTFTITNDGDENLSISSVTSNSALFIVDDSSLAGSVAPGNSTIFEVTYSPTAAGSSSATITINNSDSNEGTYTFTVTGNGTDAEITVSGNGNPISNGDTSPSTVDGTIVGSVSNGGTISQIYTITNTGDADLVLIGSPVVQISGTDAANFVVVAEPNSPLDALTGLSTFEIEFTPTRVGLHEATVTILNDDVDDPSYTFSIQGTGLVPSVFAYSAEGYNVKQGSTSVTLTVTRTSGTSPTSVRFTTIDGDAAVNKLSYQGAFAGVDYVTKDEVLNFAQDEVSKTVTVTLIPRTGKQPHRRFFGILSDVASGNSITRDWAVARIYSFTDPLLSVTTPGPTVTSLSTVSPYTISGTVRDYELFGIDRVEVSLNGATAVNATLGSGTSIVPWSLSITPVDGASNTITVQAVDSLGFVSQVVTRTFTFTRRHRLGIERTAPMGVGLDAAGTVAVAVTPTTALSLITAANVANASPREYGVLPAATVKLTAAPKAGRSFSHWSGLPGGSVQLGNVVTFTMPASDVSGVTAHFVNNPFSGPAGSSNVFYGHVRPADTADYGNASLGFITGTIVPTTGAFSGSIRIGGITQAFTGTFYGNESYLFTVGTTRPATLAFAGGRTLALTYTAASKTITATVVQGGVTSTGVLERGIYSTTNKVDNDLLNESATTGGLLVRGFYTVALTPKTQPSLAVTAYPQGAGYGTVTLTNIGSFTFAGTLADGTTFTSSSGVVSGDSAPFFNQLVTPGGAKTNLGGSFGGTLAFSIQAESDITATDLLWTRPTVTAVSGTTVAAVATRLYTAGWPSGVFVDAIGALYSRTATVQASLSLAAPNPTNGNGELVLSAGRLAAPVSVTKFNISGSAVAKIPATNPAFTLAVAAASGGFSGTFTPTWTPLSTAKPAFKGIIVAKGSAKRGYGYYISNVNNTTPQESGLVRLGNP